MSIPTGAGDDLTQKVLSARVTGADADDGRRRSEPSPRPRRLETDAERAGDDLVKLVLALVETVRQLMERQAIRRVESGALSDEDVERLGLTLMRLEERMTELRTQFGVEEGDLSLHIGTAQELMDVLMEDDAGRTERPLTGKGTWG